MTREEYLDRLRINYPTKFDLYNYNLIPEEIETDTELKITCPSHGQFKHKATIHLNTSGGCKQCGLDFKREQKRSGKIELLKDKFGDQYTYERTMWNGKGKYSIVTCKDHGDFDIILDNMIYKSAGCPRCNGRVSVEDFIAKSNAKHDNFYDYSKVVYTNTTTPVEVVCPNHGGFNIEPYLHYSRGVKCPTCAREQAKLNRDAFIEKATKVHGTQFDYRLVQCKANTDDVTIICRHHGAFTQPARSHIAGYGCTHCQRDKARGNLGDFVRSARAVHGDRYDYSKSVYKGSKAPLEIICAKHGSFMQRPNSHLADKNGCPTCTESKGESRIRMFLEEHGIKYVQEYKINPSKYRYDFYLPDYGILIEYHGQQHYRAIDFFGGKEQFDIQKERDAFKVELAKEYNLRLLVFNYTQLGAGTLEKALNLKLNIQT